MSFRTAASQLLSARSVHLRIVPRPANLSESREIFRIMQRFGDMDTFKSLRYEYHNPADNIAIAIYRDANAAQKALDASPIRFAMENMSPEGLEREGHMFDEAEDGDETGTDTSALIEDATSRPPPPKDSIDDILSPPTLTNRSPSSSTLPTTSHPTPASTPDSPPPPHNPAPKHFQITIDRARTVHQDYIERQPFWKHYNPMKSMSQEDLVRKVPHEGLSDINKRPMHAHRTPLKVLKQMNEYLERGMPSLRGMASNSEMERAFREKRGE